ncbi:hypothetical protein C8R45DRAFT_1216283 [Mycena sanguinolenta]|nr:hypothetical protein C8R45DRAFT_1216283 [Mycena sanguinolenta]
MSDPPKHSKPGGLNNFHSVRNFWETRSQAPSPQSSRSTTPNKQRPQPVPAASSNPGSAFRRTDKREDSLKGGGTAKIDKSDTVQSMHGFAVPAASIPQQ